MKKKVFGFGLLLVFWNCQQTNPLPIGFIEGQILESKTLIPLKNVKIMLALPSGGIISTGVTLLDSTRSDSRGQFRFVVDNFFGDHWIGAFLSTKDYRFAFSPTADSAINVFIPVKTEAGKTVKQNIFAER
jgi:hypothetical protein